MGDFTFNISKGSVVEKIRDSAANVGFMLLKTAEVDDTLNNYDDIAALLVPAGNVEADFTNYARKTGITGTITVDDTNNRVDVDIPDQVFSSAGGASNNTMARAICFYNDGAGDANQIPLTAHDTTAVTDGSDLTYQMDAAGIHRAA